MYKKKKFSYEAVVVVLTEDLVKDRADQPHSFTFHGMEEVWQGIKAHTVLYTPTLGALGWFIPEVNSSDLLGKILHF